jgi:hypothetical protein
MVKEESKGIKEFDDIDEFDLEALIVEGKETIIEDEVEIYIPQTKKTKKMRIYLQPISHSEWSKAVRSTGKNSNKDLEEIICSKCWVGKDGMPLPLSKIKDMQKGIVTQVYEKIKLISGQLNDPFEEKYLNKITDF